MKIYNLGFLETVAMCFGIILFIIWIWIIVRSVTLKSKDKDLILPIIVVALGPIFGSFVYIIYNVVNKLMNQFNDKIYQ